MNCPLCGWKVKQKQEWEAHGLLCGIWSCSDCETTITAQTPLHKVKEFNKRYQKDKGGKKSGKTKTGSD
jgi:ribosomal protein L37AE/L43A